MVPHARVVEEHVPAVPVEVLPHLVEGGVACWLKVLLRMLGVSRPSDGVPATAERGRGVVGGGREGRRRPLTAALIHFARSMDELRFNEILLGKSGLFSSAPLPQFEHRGRHSNSLDRASLASHILLLLQLLLTCLTACLPRAATPPAWQWAQARP